MAGPLEETADVLAPAVGDDATAAAVAAVGVKRPLDIDSLQRKKFKTDELPLTAAQHAAIEHLLHAFKKRGGFDNVRKKIWAEFEEGEGKTEFTNLLAELAEVEIDREPGLLSRERGKAATLIEGAVDRSDVYKTVEKSLDALASNHLQTILDSVREIRRDEVGVEAAAEEEKAGNKTDEDYANYIQAKRDERERAYQEALRKEKEAEEEEARKKAEEDRKRRELERQKEEEERARRREREEQRREEQRKLDEQREKERQERYERRRREERER
ncbi:BOD1/SHG1 domain-containing protein, partial [Aspergillus brunneoviolaceus CBS 621.78]